MSLRRAREHCIWYDGFGANGPYPVTDLNTASLVLKHLALFYRGLVISDADLNNNPLFFPLTQNPQAESSEAFRKAIEAGFIRRAARLVRDSSAGSRRATQAEVFKEFQERDKEASTLVPPNHPRILDDMFGVPEDVKEEEKADLIYWSRDDLDKIFAVRLVFEVDSHMTGGAAEIRTLARCVDEYARECLDQRTSVSAGTLRQTLRERADGLGSSGREAFDKVWKAVQRAYHGNLPLAFDGDLIVGASPGLGPSITGGPEATREDLRMTMRAFTQQNATGRTSVMTVVSEEGGERLPAPRMVDLGWLEAISFPEIEGRRDEAYPEEMMDLRFKVLGAPDAADDLRMRHADAMARFVSHQKEYLDNLHESPSMGQRIWLQPEGGGPRVVAAITSPDPSMPCAIADPSLFRSPEGRPRSSRPPLDQSFALTVGRYHWRGLPGGMRRDAAGRLDIRLPGRTMDVDPRGEAIDSSWDSRTSSVDARTRPSPAPVAVPRSRVRSMDAAAGVIEQLAREPNGQIQWRRLLGLEEAAQLVLLAFAYVSSEGKRDWQYVSEHFDFEDARRENYAGRTARRFSELRNRKPPLEWGQFLSVVPELMREETRAKIVGPRRGGRPGRSD